MKEKIANVGEIQVGSDIIYLHKDGKEYKGKVQCVLNSEEIHAEAD